MEVSVIIPVYNAADFVREAVESALVQPETAEILLIEDNSTDGSLTICQDLATEYAQVRLLRHFDGENHGAGPSRTLGIQESTCDYIAFLDADDYYLPERFKHDRNVFTQFPDADGVYSAIGTTFQSDSARERWFAQRDSELTTVDEIIPPDQLFEALVKGGRGFFHGDGLCVKRHIFDRTGPFDALPLHQDTAMWIKMAAVARLYPGDLKNPVAMRRFHDNNRIDAPLSHDRKLQHRQRMWETVWSWSLDRLSIEQEAMLFQQLRITYLELLRRQRGTATPAFRLNNALYLLGLLLRNPQVINRQYFPLHLPHFLP